MNVFLNVFNVRIVYQKSGTRRKLLRYSKNLSYPENNFFLEKNTKEFTD